MTADGEPARRVWARLAGLDELRGLQVVVDPASGLGRAGWIAILALDGTVTASVPRAELREPVEIALAGLTLDDAIRPAVVRPRLPPTAAVLGPAWLSYPPHDFAPGEGSDHPDPLSPAELAAFLARAPRDEVLESSMDDPLDHLFASRTATGALAAVCGYRRWANGVAHLSVLTDPTHRREGHGRRAATPAIRHAIGAGLLPQWRARPAASKALARRLGLVEMGAQLGFQPG